MVLDSKKTKQNRTKWNNTFPPVFSRLNFTPLFLTPLLHSGPAVVQGNGKWGLCQSIADLLCSFFLLILLPAPAQVPPMGCSCFTINLLSNSPLHGLRKITAPPWSTPPLSPPRRPSNLHICRAASHIFSLSCHCLCSTFCLFLYTF